MSKLRILLVAPYKELCDVALKQVQEFPNITLDTCVGDLEKGLAAANAKNLDNFDIILSRGGTATLLEQRLQKPVVSIRLTGFDMLRFIKQAQNYKGKAAIVGYPIITEPARLICQILQYNTDIATVHSQEEAVSVIHSLKQSGYGLILGDVITTSTAAKMGLPNILATSGPESLRSAFKQAMRYKRDFDLLNEQNRMFVSAMELNRQLTAITDANGNLVWSSFTPDAQLLEQLKEHIPEALDKRSCELFLNYNSSIWRTYVRFEPEKSRHVFWYLGASVLASQGKNTAFTFTNPDDEHVVSFNAFICESPVMKELIATAMRFKNSKLPIMITGKRNTEKEHLAQAFYWDGPLNNRPMLTIDMKMMTDKIWQRLFESEASPLASNMFTVLFKNFHGLPLSFQMELDHYIENTQLTKRHRIITTSSLSLQNMYDNPDYYMPLVEKLSVLSLHAPMLKERREDIASIAMLYINEYNREFSKQVVGLEPKALTLLENFSWPNNVDQLKKTICQAMLLTDTPHITAATISSIIQSLDSTDEPEQVTTAIHLGGTLDEITRQVISLVLAEEEMNQSRAAARLGISRTTMWRKLNEK